MPNNFTPDKKIMNLVDAISGRESNYGKNTVSKLSTQEGSFGGLQYTPARFNEDKAKYLPDMDLDINNDRDQKILKYAEVSSKIAEGWDIDRIIAAHNAGDAGSANWKTLKETNKYGNKFDVPAYVADVKRRYKSLSEGAIEPDGKESVLQKVGGFGRNILKSGGEFLGSIGSALLHPVDTVENIGKLGAGSLDLLLGDGQGQNADMVRAVGNIYKERYGGISNIGNTLYDDPVGVLADAATVLSGGAGVASKLGMVGKLGEAGKLGQVSNVASRLSSARDVASYLSKASKVVDPLSAITGTSKALGNVRLGETTVGSAIKDLPFQVLGLTTGKGAETFKQIYDAARAGRSGAVSGMRGGANAEELVAKLDNAMSFINTLKKNVWNKLGLDKKTRSLDISSIFKALDDGLKDLKVTRNADGSLDFSRARGAIRYDADAQRKIQTITESLDGYGLKAGDRLPSSIDDLKQSFQSLYSDTSDVKSFVEKMRKSTRDVLSSVDGYDEYAKKYENLQDLVNQLKTELSAGSKNSNTTYRKLINSLKQTNTEGRQAILKTLQQEGVSDIIDTIAGMTANKWLPNDAVRGGAGVFALSTGNALSLPAFSPRIVGETTNLAGKTVGSTQKLLNNVKNTKAGETLRYIGGQVYSPDNMTRSSTLNERIQEARKQNQQGNIR